MYIKELCEIFFYIDTKYQFDNDTNEYLDWDGQCGSE